MTVSRKDRQILRDLGEQYMCVATAPVMKEKIELWKSLNRSRMQRPMVCLDQLPWNELNSAGELTCLVEDGFWRGVERILRETTYKWNHFPVDMVVEPFITVPQAIRNSMYALNADVDKLELAKDSTAPSQHYNTVLKEYDDIEKIKDMELVVDAALNRAHMDEAAEIFAGIAPVIQGHGIQFHLGIWDYLTTLMGVENAYLDIIDRPDFIHACMERITEATIAGICKANELRIHDDISNLCHCSYIYTDDLLPDCGQGKGPLSQNSWAFGMAQLFTSVSPGVTREFELPYISRMASCFGRIYYGCCDRLDDRLEIVKSIPNLRKVSCSPWSERERFAEEIGTALIMSNKPTPAFLAADTVNWEAVRADLRRTITAARANHVNLEIILKDISTVRDDPQRLTHWAEIAMEEVQE